jgi:hypothetical protein
MTTIFAQTAGGTDPDISDNIVLDGTYEIYCAAFRTYLLEHYPDPTPPPRATFDSTRLPLLHPTLCS